MKQVVIINNEVYNVTKEFAMEAVEDLVADWIVALEDFSYGLDDVDKGERYIILEDGSFYHEDDDPSDLLKLAGFEVEWLEDYGEASEPYYDKDQMQWMI